MHAAAAIPPGQNWSRQIRCELPRCLTTHIRQPPVFSAHGSPPRLCSCFPELRHGGAFCESSPSPSTPGVTLPLPALALARLPANADDACTPVDFLPLWTGSTWAYQLTLRAWLQHPVASFGPNSFCPVVPTGCCAYCAGPKRRTIRSHGVFERSHSKAEAFPCAAKLLDAT